MDRPPTGQTPEGLPAPAIRIETITDPTALPAAWTKLVSPDHPLLGIEWLKAACQSLSDGAHTRCVLAWQGPDLIGAAFFEAIPLRIGALGAIETSAPWTTRTAIRLLAASHSGPPHVVVCGDILRNDVPAAHFDPDIASPARLLHAMAEAARVDINVSTIMVICSARSLGPDADQLTTHGYHRVDKAEPPMRVELASKWQSFDDYIQAMRPKYRQRTRSARKAGHEVTRAWLSSAEIGSHVDAFDQLLRPILAKAPVTVSVPSGETIIALKRALGDACRVRAYTHGDTLIAFAVSLHTANALEGLLVGFDPQQNTQFKLYQNILYDFIEEAIHTDAAYASLGRTALEIKSAVGATPTEVPVYIRHPSALMHSVLGWVAGGLPSTTWTPRNPFRSGVAEPNSAQDHTPTGSATAGRDQPLL